MLNWAKRRHLLPVISSLIYTESRRWVLALKSIKFKKERIDIPKNITTIVSFYLNFIIIVQIHIFVWILIYYFKVKSFLALILFTFNLIIWGFFWYALSSDPKFQLPLVIAFITFLICYFLLPKLFFQTGQKVFSLTTYDYIWAQLKWANGVGFTVGFLSLLFLS